ncbi:MAG TPA: hypothetical protein VFD70_25705 [Anaerolineae bacterium]|nr:hypothetical protein [Anaerolineae bacterium]
MATRVIELVGNNLAAGQTQDFFAFGFGPRDALAVTAIAGRFSHGGTPRYLLSVENVRVETHGGDTLEEPIFRVFLTVRNLGADTVPNYAVNIGVISP